MRYTLSELPSLKYVDLGEIIKGGEDVSLYQKESERYQHKEYIISLNAVRRNVGHCPFRKITFWSRWQLVTCDSEGNVH